LCNIKVYMSTRQQRQKISSNNRTVVRDLTRNGRPLPRTTIIEFSDLSSDDLKPSPIMDETSVELQDLKTDEAAMLYDRIDNRIGHPDGETEKPTVAIHNFASRFHCGGGYVRGARAQEEDLCRVIPELYASMSRANYPHGETTIWITSNVRIMRGSDNYSLLKEEQYVPVVVVSAAAPALSRNREKWTKTECVIHSSISSFR
jgi:hypothetical protein